ncbi:MAG: CarD family transcriptional regulator [Candidatus Omnitrophota bacterium]
MSFSIGDHVVKPGLGICKIKAIRKMQVEGKEQQFYVLQSGDVNVMVPFAHAHGGGLRPLLDEEGMNKVLAFLSEPILIPENEDETSDRYAIEVYAAKDEIKHRNPDTAAQLLKTLFYRSKIVELDKSETAVFQEAMIVLAEEYAHLHHTTRQKAMHQLRSSLKEGRKARRDHTFR